MLTVFRYALLICGILIGLPLLVFLSLLPKTPISFVGTVYRVSDFRIVAGMIFAPWQQGLSFVLIFIGCTIALITITFRTLFPPLGTHINRVTLPGPSVPGS